MGKPKLLNLSSFILLEVEAMMKLDGLTLRSRWAELGKESTYLGIQRFVDKQGVQLPQTLKAGLVETFSEIPESAWKASFIKALNGDQDAQDLIHSLGQWETFRGGFSSSIKGGLCVWIDQLVEIEKASRSVDLHLAKGEFAQAASLAGESLALRPYLSAAATAWLGCATNDKEALPARVTGLCEVLMSQIARVEWLSADLPNFAGGFAHLTQFDVGKPCKPGRQFFAWIKRVLRIKTLAEFQIQATRNGVPVIDESTIKRWSSGREFPSTTKLDRLITALNAHRAVNGMEPVPSDRIFAQYWAARRLQKLLNLARLLWAADDLAQGSNRPWSSMMGYASAEAWVQARYPFWQDHWSRRLRDQASAEEKKG
jgi:hypothetical protein